jgi:hypothetical protein
MHSAMLEKQRQTMRLAQWRAAPASGPTTVFCPFSLGSSAAGMGGDTRPGDDRGEQCSAPSSHPLANKYAQGFRFII